MVIEKPRIDPVRRKAAPVDAEVLALAPDDQHFLVQMALERPLMVELEREARLTAEGLVERRFGQLALTPKARHLLGVGPAAH